MTDQEINEAIALELGWKMPTGAVNYLIHPSGKKVFFSPMMEPAPLPDYCNDLNAMHEAAKALTQNQRRKYADEVCEMSFDGVCDPDIERLLLMSPKELSVAMVRAIGKWRAS